MKAQQDAYFLLWAAGYGQSALYDLKQLKKCLEMLGYVFAPIVVLQKTEPTPALGNVEAQSERLTFYNEHLTYDPAHVAVDEAEILQALRSQVIVGKSPKDPVEGQLYARSLGEWEDHKMYLLGVKDPVIYRRLRVKGLKRAVKAYQLSAPNGKTTKIRRSSLEGEAKPGSLWTWPMKQGLEAKAYVDAHKVTKPLTKAQKRRSQERLGTCPCWFKLDSNNRIVRHGWREGGGRRKGQYGRTWHSGQCFGVGYRPFEYSCEGTRHFREHLESTTLPAIEAEIQRLKDRPEALPHSFKRTTRISQDHNAYTTILQGLIREQEYLQKQLKVQIIDLRVCEENWDPQPLPNQA